MSETSLQTAGWVPAAGGRFERMMGYLEADPDNASLLSDAADAALDERQPPAAWALLARLAKLRPLTPTQQGLLGVAGMQTGDFEGAAEAFSRLLETKPDDSALRFNAAWCAAALGRADEARALLDDEAAAVIPDAALLEVRLMHEAGALDEAVARARERLAQHPDHAGLAATVSTLAIDAEDTALAKACAEVAGDHPDALTTLGTLALAEGSPDEAIALFERTLAKTERAPRALVGRGLARLEAGDTSAGAADLDQGAELFETHLGSWIAAGWAHYSLGDIDAAKARFERAMTIDDTFSECHGSLAVIDALEGRADEARRRVRTAFGLDRQCLSAALAQSLLQHQTGDEDGARQVMDRALNAPVGLDGTTIAHAIARMRPGR